MAMSVFWASNLTFCLTGIAMVVLVQWEDYAGLGSATTALNVLPLFLGQAGCVGELFRDTDHRRYEHRMWGVAMLNLMGEILLQACIAISGSALYVVLFSSSTVFAALLKWGILGVLLSPWQWGSIVLIMLGLVLSSVNDLATSSTDPLHTAVGVCCGLGAALVYAGYYTLSEMIVKGYGKAPEDTLRPPSPATLAAFSGLVNSFIIGLYILLYDGPRWQQQVASEVAETGTPYLSIVCVYLVLIVMDGLHMLAIFYLVREGGAVVVAINKAVQSVLTFAASHVFYCAFHREQCFTDIRGISMALVCSGVVLYAWASPAAPQHDDAGVELSPCEEHALTQASNTKRANYQAI